MEKPHSKTRGLQAKAEQRVTELRQAIAQLENTRRRLQMAANEAKSEIQSAISRQLNSLRSREVFLRNQVEVIQQAKEETLHSQQHELNKALGALTSCLKSAPQDRRLQEELRRIESLELKPEETANICFRADMTKLREAMHGFGKVEARHIPLSTAFMDPDSGSTSLPRPFEDYEDAEHHVLYKTIEDVKREKHSDVVNVTIPKLIPKPQWLIAASDPSPRPPIPPPLQHRLHQGKGTSAHRQGSSIQQWLAQIQQHVENEDDGFEFSSPALSMTSELDTLRGLQSKQSDEVPTASPMLAYFNTVSGAPTANWLGKEDQGGSSPTSDLFAETMQYFHEVANSTKKWLVSYEDKHIQEKDSECNSACSNPKSLVDIENLATVECIQDSVSKYFRQMDQDSRVWLCHSPMKRDVDADVDEKEDGYMGFCKANEPCQSYEDCLNDVACSKSSPAYFDRIWESIVLSPAKEWLSESRNPAKVEEDLITSPLFDYFQVVGTYPMSDWLQQKPDLVNSGWDDAMFDTNITAEVENAFPIFADHHSACVGEWLHPDVSRERSKYRPEELFAYFTETIASDSAIWLKSPCEEVSGEPVSSEWLLVGKPGTPKIEVIDPSGCLHIGVIGGPYRQKAWKEEGSWLLEELEDAPDSESAQMMNAMLKQFHLDAQHHAWLQKTEGGEAGVKKHSTSKIDELAELEDSESENIDVKKHFDSIEPGLKDCINVISCKSGGTWLVDGKA